MGDSYVWVLALHVISVIAWMAGLLYLPRLFVYHAEATPGSEMSETFKVMERRLLRVIMNPAMIGVWIFGIWNLVLGEWWREPWMHAKLTLVVILTVYHHLLARWRKDFAEDRNTRSAKFYRMTNEVPTVIMIGIVILVLVKPF
ncbi:MAG: protoporphyrinogen oxidase HemJ [Alphaproteobacteria bacterium]|nr:protoporphyrinogen oxidase HemJ [Alphaproteobacteria bacterium]